MAPNAAPLTTEAPHGRAPTLLATAGTALALALIAVIALRQPRHDRPRTAAQLVTQALPGAQPQRTTAPVTASGPFSLFVVADDEQVGALAHEYEGLIGTDGRPALDPRHVQVIVVRTPADPELVRDRLDALRALVEERVQVIDQRPSRAAALSPGTLVCGLDTCTRDC